MDLVRLSDQEEMEKVYERAKLKLEEYEGACSPYELQVQAEAQAVKDAYELKGEVIDLPTTIGRSWKALSAEDNWQNGYKVDDTPMWPQLAVVDARYTMRSIRCRSFADGSVEFSGGTRFRRERVKLPSGTDPKPNRRSRFTQAYTVAPPIPPKFQSLVRPGILLMWEADEWREPKVPTLGGTAMTATIATAKVAAQVGVVAPLAFLATLDPVLLERVGNTGFLYKVIAEWELSEVERRCMIPV